MKTLFQLQEKFQGYLLGSCQDIKHHIISTQNISSEMRLDIYKNAYRKRLIDSLATNYPILKIHLGYQKFNELASQYLKQNPSTDRSVRWFGDEFAVFLEKHSEYKPFPHLAELAKLEWILTLVFDALDSPVTCIEAVSAIPADSWPNMQLLVHPSVHRLNFSWNTVEIWEAVSHDQPLPKPMKNTSLIHWILWRNHLTTQFSSIQDDEAWAIDAVIRGINFGELCEGLCQRMDEQDAPIYAASLLKKWISSGLISEIKI